MCDPFSSQQQKSHGSCHGFLLYSHPDLLGCPCDRGKQGHQTGLVHLAAVAGEGVVAALHAEGKHDLTYHIGIKRGVALRDAFAHCSFHAVDEQPLTGAGKQNADLGLLPGKRPEHFPGHNLGDKNAYIGNGIDELRRIKEIKEVRVSELLVTKPYGGVEQDDFVNGAIALKTLLSPQELLEKLHEIEQHANRERIIHWGPRTLDLDIIFYDKLVYEDENLIIPHIDMQNRDFVLKPLAELCPNYRHPVFGKTVSQLLGELKER